MNGTTRVMQTSPYRGYFITVNPTKAPAGRLKDCFSIHKLKEDSVDWTVTVYTRTIEQAADYPTETEATEAALRHAGAWIDAQYPQDSQSSAIESRNNGKYAAKVHRVLGPGPFADNFHVYRHPMGDRVPRLGAV